MLLSSMILNNTIKVKKIPAENERLVKLETGVILLNFKNIYVVSSPTEIRRGVQASAQNKKWLSNFLKLSKNYRFSKKSSHKSGQEQNPIFKFNRKKCSKNFTKNLVTKAVRKCKCDKLLSNINSNHHPSSYRFINTVQTVIIFVKSMVYNKHSKI